MLTRMVKEKDIYKKIDCLKYMKISSQEINIYDSNFQIILTISGRLILWISVSI